jgi:radical SAM superfamily enzyme YgiQ (UPF0313 family)
MSTNRKKILKARDYLQSEEGTIIKNGRGNPSVALVYPNTYYLGMSNLGMQTLYALFNADEDAVCERVFLPDEAVLRDTPLPRPLRSLEKQRPVNDFDCVAFSISFENDYLYVLNILDLAGIPFYARERGETDPIVIAGGAALTINPEPIADFMDAIFIGEAEEAAAEILEVLKSDLSRDTKITALGKIEGIYLPSETDFSDSPAVSSSICPSNPKPNSLENRVPLSWLRKYKRRVPHDINGFPVETAVYTPYSEFGKLSLIEVQRGCGRGCKFCAEGFIYTPFRERDFGLIKEQVLRGLKYRPKIGLIGADLLVYPQILELMRFIHDSGGTFSPSSVRLDALTPEIIAELVKSEHKTLAIAPEAGSSDLRRQINKKFDNDAVIRSIENLLVGGIPNIKMYLMLGLPGEKHSDIDELIELVSSARGAVLLNAKKSGRMGNLILSLNPFIPKPRTPYQVGVFEGIETLEDKVALIKKKLVPQGSIRVYYENPFFAYVQALLSNGRRHVGDYLIEVFKNQGLLKKSLAPFENSTRDKIAN